MAAAKVKKPDIYSRLTDPKLYTGAHKQRFDADGKGRGKDGRTDTQINDLSNLTRRSSGAASKPVARKPVVSSKPHILGSGTPAPTGMSKKVASPAVASSAAAPAAAASPSASSPTNAKVAKKGDIYSRLTDPKLYTGAHKQRFDSDGKGKGISGRTDVQINDLSQLTRRTGSKSVSSPSKAGTVSGVSPMQVQKFGTQAAVAKKIHVFQNGDKNHKGVVITLVKGLANMNKVLGEITNKLTLTTGAAQRVYRVIGNGESFTQVQDLASFEDGGIYLACGPEKIDKTKLPSALQGSAASA